jgi:alpha/beta hydrolase fold
MATFPPQACTTTAMPAHGRIPTLTSIRTTGVEDAVGGIFGRWAQPAETGEGSAILHLDYRLAREGPFPAAVEDAEACCGGLVDRGIRNIALSGDSAGGNLALVLLSIATAQSA